MSSKESKAKSDEEVRHKSKDKHKKDDKRKESNTEEKDKKHRDSREDKHKKHTEPRSPGHRRRRSRSHSPTSRSKNKNNDRERSSHHQRRRSRSRSRSKDRSRDAKRERRRSRSTSREKHGNDKKRGRVRDELRNRKLFAMGLTESSSSSASAPKATSEALAAAVMANTLLDSNQERAIKAQLDHVKAITGVDLPKYYNPTAINPLKYAEQIKKRQLLWGQKKADESSTPPEPTPIPLPQVQEQYYQHEDQQQSGASFNKWEKTNFGNSHANEKFRRLMGIKGSVETDKVSDAPPVDSTKIFGQLEKEYERARAITHTQRGLGLGFSGSSNIPPNTSHPE